MAAKGKRKQAGQAPISSHPAFPAIVALWFAALFGIGSMVLPVVLLEKLVTATGIASLVPAAAPPLGVTARILIALVAAGIGVVLGVVLVRRVASAQVGQPPIRRAPRLRAADAHPDAPAKRPISAREELGSETLDDPFDVADRLADPQFAEPMPGRRRALSVTDESGRSEFLDSAPLSFRDAGVAAAAGIVNDEDALELEYAELTDETPPVPDVALPLPNTDLRTGAEATADAIREPETNVEAEPMPFEPQDFATPMEAETAARPFDRAGATAAALAAEAVPAGTSAQEQHVSPAPIDGPLTDLSVAQLVERFARALQAKAAEVSAPSESVVASESEVAFEPSSAQAASFADAHEEQDLTVPEALRPLDLGEFAGDEDEADYDLAGLSLQLGGSAKPFARPAHQPAPSDRPATQEETDDDFEGETGGEGYSSLLNMKRPLPTGQEFVRIEDEGDDAGSTGPEPVVVFPNQHDRRAAHPAAGAMPTAPVGQPVGHARPFEAPSASESGLGNGSFAPAAPTNPPVNRADPSETEKALHEALEKLQRMSGAA